MPRTKNLIFLLISSHYDIQSEILVRKITTVSRPPVLERNLASNINEPNLTSAGSRSHGRDPNFRTLTAGVFRNGRNERFVGRAS